MVCLSAGDKFTRAVCSGGGVDKYLASSMTNGRTNSAHTHKHTVTYVHALTLLMGVGVCVVYMAWGNWSCLCAGYRCSQLLICRVRIPRTLPPSHLKRIECQCKSILARHLRWTNHAAGQSAKYLLCYTVLPLIPNIYMCMCTHRCTPDRTEYLHLHAIWYEYLPYNHQLVIRNFHTERGRIWRWFVGFGQQSVGNFRFDFCVPSDDDAASHSVVDIVN